MSSMKDTVFTELNSPSKVSLKRRAIITVGIVPAITAIANCLPAFLSLSGKDADGRIE